MKIVILVNQWLEQRYLKQITSKYLPLKINHHLVFLLPEVNQVWKDNMFQLTIDIGLGILKATSLFCQEFLFSYST